METSPFVMRKIIVYQQWQVSFGQCVGQVGQLGV